MFNPRVHAPAQSFPCQIPGTCFREKYQLTRGKAGAGKGSGVTSGFRTRERVVSKNFQSRHGSRSVVCRSQIPHLAAGTQCVGALCSRAQQDTRCSDEDRRALIKDKIWKDSLLHEFLSKTSLAHTWDIGVRNISEFFFGSQSSRTYNFLWRKCHILLKRHILLFQENEILKAINQAAVSLWASLAGTQRSWEIQSLAWSGAEERLLNKMYVLLTPAWKQRMI